MVFKKKEVVKKQEPISIPSIMEDIVEAPSIPKAPIAKWGGGLNCPTFINKDFYSVWVTNELKREGRFHDYLRYASGNLGMKWIRLWAGDHNFALGQGIPERVALVKKVGALAYNQYGLKSCINIASVYDGFCGGIEPIKNEDFFWKYPQLIDFCHALLEALENEPWVLGYQLLNEGRYPGTKDKGFDAAKTYLDWWMLMKPALRQWTKKPLILGHLGMWWTAYGQVDSSEQLMPLFEMYKKADPEYIHAQSYYNQDKFFRLDMQCCAELDIPVIFAEWGYSMAGGFRGHADTDNRASKWGLKSTYSLPNVMGIAAWCLGQNDAGIDSKYPHIRSVDSWQEFNRSINK